MQEFINVESSISPSTTTPYGKNGIDYNFNIVEFERENEDGTKEKLFKYDVYRFEDKFDFLNWKYENNIHIKD